MSAGHNEMSNPVPPDWDMVRQQLKQLTDTAKPVESRECVERRIFTAVNTGDWVQVLELLGQLRGNLSRELAGDCIFFAIHGAPPEVLEILLECGAFCEYAANESYSSPWKPDECPESDWEIEIDGTAVMHAVAENKPEHLALLLQKGHDVNGASAQAATALMKQFKECAVTYGKDYIPYHPYTARPESNVKLQIFWPGESPAIQINGATPLALALLCGHAACAKVLVEHGAWLENSPGVSQAMWLLGREEDTEYQAARRYVLAQQGAHRPILWAAGKTCSPAQLKYLLETYSYSRQELVEAARAMLIAFPMQRNLWQDENMGWSSLGERLQLIGTADAEALCAPDVAGLLLLTCGRFKKYTLEPFLPFWEGRQVDLSDLEGRHFWLEGKEGRKMLELLASRSTCVMERDAVLEGTRKIALDALLRNVTFLPPNTDKGVSGLTMSILNSGDMRLIRKALRCGLIPPEETTAELLQCQKEMKLSPVCRTVLLSMSREHKQPERRIGYFFESRRGRWFANGFPNDPRPILNENDWKEWIEAAMRTSCCMSSVELAGQCWSVEDMLMLLCLTGKQEAVEYWLDRCPWALRNTDHIVESSRECSLVLTPLAAAAFGGWTELVDRLIERGAAVEETLWGNPSIWNVRKSESETDCRPITPLLLAIVSGKWECAVSLLEHGAVCDLQEESTCSLWQYFHCKDMNQVLKEHLNRYVKNNILRR